MTHAAAKFIPTPVRRNVRAHHLAQILAFQDGLARAEMRKLSMPKWIQDVVFEVARRHGVPPVDVVSASRRRVVVKARNEVLYEVKRARPDFSFPRIGFWFNRDHTSVMHAVWRHAVTAGVPRLSGIHSAGTKFDGRFQAKRGSHV